MLRGDLGLPYSRDPAGAAAASWAPSDLADIKYWWKTDSSPTTITITGSGVSSWVDEISGQDLVQGTDSRRPVVASNFLNGLDGVQFDGTDDAIRTTFTALTQPFTTVVIYQFQSSPANNDRIHDGGTGFLTYYNSGGNWTIFAGSAVASSTAVDTNAHYGVNLYNGASSYMRLDGSEIQTGNPGANTMDGFTLAARWNETQNESAITIVEAIVIDGALSAGDLASLESYLSDRSGI